MAVDIGSLDHRRILIGAETVGIIIRELLLVKVVRLCLVLAAGLDDRRFLFKSGRENLIRSLQGSLAGIDDFQRRNALIGRIGCTKVELDLIGVDERERAVEPQLVFICAAAAYKGRRSVVGILLPVVAALQIRIVIVLNSIFAVDDDHVREIVAENFKPVIFMDDIRIAVFPVVDFVAIVLHRGNSGFLFR